MSVRHYTLILLTALMLGACASGVDRTDPIRLTKDDIKAEEVSTPESQLLVHITGTEAAHWQRGKRFYAADERASLLFRNCPVSPAGLTLSFMQAQSYTSPGGEPSTIVTFADSLGHTFTYYADKSSPQTLISTSIPMLIDMDVIEQIEATLKGRSLWTKSLKWLDPATLEPCNGRRFEEVKVDRVEAGTTEFPCKVIFHDVASGRTGALLFNPFSTTSRPFASQFYLDNPRNNYKNIAQEKWDEICAGHISPGMTKEEARLSLGSPKETHSGHDYSKTIDNWYYPDGVYLHFEDGILVNFRK